VRGLAIDPRATGHHCQHDSGPGPIETDMNPADGPPLQHSQKSRTAQTVWGTPMMSPRWSLSLPVRRANFITGAALNVDGGYSGMTCRGNRRSKTKVAVSGELLAKNSKSFGPRFYQWPKARALVSSLLSPGTVAAISQSSQVKPHLYYSVVIELSRLVFEVLRKDEEFCPLSRTEQE